MANSAGMEIFPYNKRYGSDHPNIETNGNVKLVYTPGDNDHLPADHWQAIRLLLSVSSYHLRLFRYIPPLHVGLSTLWVGFSCARAGVFESSIVPIRYGQAGLIHATMNLIHGRMFKEKMVLPVLVSGSYYRSLSVELRDQAIQGCLGLSPDAIVQAVSM